MRRNPLTRRTGLLLVLTAELLSAGALRWRLTTATIKTNVEYLLAQEVIASENWRREGAVARHFVPSRSIDQRLPEWAYRDRYWRDYLSEPPLAFMLHYWASRTLDRVEPVVVGKLLAQGLIAIGVFLSGLLLYEVFGFWGDPRWLVLSDLGPAISRLVHRRLLLDDSRAGLSTAARLLVSGAVQTRAGIA